MSTELFSAPATAFLEGHARRLAAVTPRETAERIEALVARHDAWRGHESLNLNPAEGLLSRRCRALLASDMATRLTEGVPGDKIYPHGPLNLHVDEIEATVIAQAQRLFGVRYVEWRPVSNSMANGAVFAALLKHGDVILAQDEDGGGNYSYQSGGPAGVFGATVLPIAVRGAAFEIDAAALKAQAEKHRPKMIVIGGSKVLFPYPVAEMRAIADAVGALLVYDAAHLGLHISGGGFQRPLEEGAHVVTLSTHKVMGGPVGGLILTNEIEVARALSRMMFPGLLQTRDINKYAALAVALAESIAFGPDLSPAMVANARRLGTRLHARGFELIGAGRGFTNTHQLFVRLKGSEEAARFESRCHAANIFVADCALAGDMARGVRSGARIATHEITRLGMGPAEMDLIADLIARAFDGADAEVLKREVGDLAARFSKVRYSFDA